MDKFSNRLSFAMTYRNLSQTDLAKKVGVSEPLICMYLKGKNTPRQDTLYNLSQSLGVRPDWLLGYDVPMLNTTLPTVEDTIKRKISSLSIEQLERLDKMIDLMFYYDKKEAKNEQTNINIW